MPRPHPKPRPSACRGRGAGACPGRRGAARAPARPRHGRRGNGRGRRGGELRERCRGGASDEAVEDDRYRAGTRGGDGTADGGELAPAEATQSFERTRKRRPMVFESGVDDRDLAREPCGVDPGSGPRPGPPLPPKRAAARAAAAVVLPIPISPTRRRSCPALTARQPISRAAAHSASLMAGAVVKSAVGRSARGRSPREWRRRPCTAG